MFRIKSNSLELLFKIYSMNYFMLIHILECLISREDKHKLFDNILSEYFYYLNYNKSDIFTKNSIKNY